MLVIGESFAVTTLAKSTWNGNLNNTFSLLKDISLLQGNALPINFLSCSLLAVIRRKNGGERGWRGREERQNVYFY